MRTLEVTNTMVNMYDILLQELVGHLEGLEEEASVFCSANYKAKMRIASAHIYSVRCLLRKKENAAIMEWVRQNTKYKDRFLSVLGRFYALLSLMYLPHSTKDLKTYMEEALDEIVHCLINYGWQ